MSGALLGLSSKFQDVLAQKQHLAWAECASTSDL
eukprot:CAMPEP_0182849234 /NCGR_PEP_ID=MMETSP0006_2-20121128/29448_1 /TAXON_ID=97485 /ORGANISM="Prymnesium parvum, Strain Texoma1" /LENGTH=33 /DNA_ID= /DNA_START= /DNA_END= /DNA_ORIENTATION=